MEETTSDDCLIDSVKNFYNNGGADMVNDQQIPKKLLDMALGIVFLHTAKAGFIVTGSIGTGLVIARCDDGSWSAPCALATVTVGVGFQVGAEATNYVLILTTRGAVRTFMGKHFAHSALCIQLVK